MLRPANTTALAEMSQSRGRIRTLRRHRHRAHKETAQPRGMRTEPICKMDRKRTKKAFTGPILRHRPATAPALGPAIQLTRVQIRRLQSEIWRERWMQSN